MIVYHYQDPEGEHTITREGILKEYYPWWCEQMKKAGKENQISEDACVDDFVVVHWAYKAEE